MTGTPVPPSRRRGLAGVAVQLVLLAALAVFVVRFVDREQIALAVASVSLASFLVFFVLMMATRLVAAWRWRVVARDLGLAVGFGFLLRVSLLAEFANIWLQSFIGGEAVRIWKLVQETGNRNRGAGSVALDRFVGTVSLALVCLPFVPVLGAAAEVPEPPGDVALLALLAALAAAAAAVVTWRFMAALRRLARRALAFAGRTRFLAVPLLISAAVYPLLVAAHYLGFPELGARPWTVAAALALLPRLGRVVPLSVFGLTAVEGSTVLVGALLGVSSQTLLAIVALNLTVKYVASLAGALAETAVSGTRFFRVLRERRLGAETVIETIEAP